MFSSIKDWVTQKVVSVVAGYGVRRLLEVSTWLGLVLALFAHFHWNISQDQAVALAKWIVEGIGLLMTLLPTRVLTLGILGKVPTLPPHE